jgi:hypothetical protein
MMGNKKRGFGPLPPVTLEYLVPTHHFYRDVERTLDLGFVHHIVRDAIKILSKAGSLRLEYKLSINTSMQLLQCMYKYA